MGVERTEAAWIVSAMTAGGGRCPGCGLESNLRHGWYVRQLQDLPVQGARVILRLRLARWRCRNPACGHQTFGDRLPDVAPLFARRTGRVIDLARLLTHAVGGRPAERLVIRLGLPQSDDTLLRSLKTHMAGAGARVAPRIVGIDDWARRKGRDYGTILVDLERRAIIDVLMERSADATARWFAAHPGVEIVSRDRCGLYAEGAARGAPDARQVTDRFHLIDNLRENIERQLNRAPSQRPVFDPTKVEVKSPAAGAVVMRYPSAAVIEDHRLGRDGRRAAKRAKFDRIKALLAAGQGIGATAREAGLNWRTVKKWSEMDKPPERRTMAPKSSTPALFRDYLGKRWSEGMTFGRDLLAEIRERGYTGSLTHLQRLLKQWRQAHFAAVSGGPAAQQECPVTAILHPANAAALCIKPRGQLTAKQVATIDRLKQVSSDFAVMRGLVMRFRGILRGGDASRLEGWLNDAFASGIHWMRQFVITLKRDIDAVRNAITTPWSNGQTEGQINKLKTLKRAMYGRAGIDLLRARLLPLHPTVSRAI